MRFADEGADVIALDIPDLGGELRDTAREVENRGRRLDVVVANAGIHTAGAPSWELDPQVWQRTLDINLTGVWHTVKAGVPHIGARAEFAEATRRMNMLAVPWIEPVDVANAALFLASDDARYITAVTLPVDAGATHR